MLESLKTRARLLKQETLAIYLASTDPRTPWPIKALIWFVVAHTFSPIDLIPDFIPVLGYLDDLIITPAGLALAIRLIPPEVLAQARESARQARGPRRSVGWLGAAGILLVWILLIGWLTRLVLPFFK